MILKNVRLHGEMTDVVLGGGKILSVGKTAESGREMNGAKIFPGLIDIHTHGCIGYDTMEGHVREMAEYQRSCGITTFYPTTMTMPLDEVRAATWELPDTGAGAHVPGFHAEGPYINAKYRGAQNEAYIRLPKREEFDTLRHIALITIAPEVEGALDFIRDCPAVVCVGHTDADYETAKAAFSAGARCLTHTYNAMPSIHHRAPGPIGAGMDSGAYAQLISDGRHVHPSAVRMLFRLFGEDRVILISDSLRATGMGDGTYSFGGQEIVVRDGLALTPDGHIAGSSSTLFDCVRCAVSFGIPEEVAVKAATENPARLMGLNKGVIAPGYDADILLVDDDFHLIDVILDKET